MLKKIVWISTPLVMLFHSHALAIKLDCVHNPDETYTCVEIVESNEAVQAHRAYIEAAKAECIFPKIHKRSGGKTSGAAVRMEERKAAEKEYQRCVAGKAAELKNAEQ